MAVGVGRYGGYNTAVEKVNYGSWILAGLSISTYIVTTYLLRTYNLVTYNMQLHNNITGVYDT